MKKSSRHPSPILSPQEELVRIMPEPAAPPGGAPDRADLGQRLKRLRTENGWTMEEVSRKAGVSRSTLSKIEAGQMSPTYDVLQKLIRGLDLDIGELFGTKPQNPPGGRRSITRRGEGKRHESSAYLYELLIPDLAKKAILTFKATIRARSLEEFDGWVRHEGEEFLYVLSGSVEVFTEFYAPASLGAGDSIYFDSNMGHAVVSRSEGDAEVLWVCTGAPVR
jgi:transcriptional regulator with XRE-family HTH domain